MNPYGRFEVADYGHARRVIERHGLRRSKPRIAFVTIGQAPRVDVAPDILGMLDGVADYQEFGALDGLTPAEIASQTERGSERRLYTRLRGGRHVEADAMRLHLSDLGAATGVVSIGLPTAPLKSEALIDRLPPPSVPLTPRERQILACVMDGEANKVIARRLGISHRTVEIHRGRAMNKLEAGSPVELIRRVLLLSAAGG